MDEKPLPQETAQTVSNEDAGQEHQPETKKDDEAEFKLPASKEEFDTLIKSAVNKEKTNFLKELGVKSVKEYKEKVSSSEEALTKYAEAVAKSDAPRKEKETLSKENEALKRTSAFDRLGVKEEYREDLLKLAEGKASAENPFEAVIKNLVETKYQHVVQKSTVKIGSEKTAGDKTPDGVSPALASKYSWLKS